MKVGELLRLVESGNELKQNDDREVFVWCHQRQQPVPLISVLLRADGTLDMYTEDPE